MAVTDLTNTKWVINSVECTAGYCIINNMSGTLYNSQGGPLITNISCFHIGYRLNRDFDLIATANTVTVNTDPTKLIVGNYIEFGDFGDLTNATLISWLEAHATQIVTTPTAVFDLDTLGLSAGTYSITAKAEGSGFQDSVASNAVSFTVAPSGYQVTITNTGDGIFAGIIVVNDTDGYANSSGDLSNYYPNATYIGTLNETLNLTGVNKIIFNPTSREMYATASSGDLSTFPTSRTTDVLEFSITQNSSVTVYWRD